MTEKNGRIGLIALWIGVIASLFGVAGTAAVSQYRLNVVELKTSEISHDLRKTSDTLLEIKNDVKWIKQRLVKHDETSVKSPLRLEP